MSDIPAKTEHAGKPDVENVMVKVNGKTFRCECGCNVFHKGEHSEQYVCNSCGLVYSGE